MIEATQLGKRFGETWAVRELNFAVAAGEVFGLLGPNGAGKTTTLRLLGALLRPTDGTASVAGYTLGRQDDAIRRQVGFQPGEPGFYEALSAEANLTFHARLRGVPGAKRQERVRTCLELVDLWARRSEPVGSFSKGMKQRLALARVLLHAPSVLLLDEPTAGLDPLIARRVREILLEERQRGTTIVVSTHDLEEARQVCDRVAFLGNRLLRVETPAALSHALFGRRLRVRLANPTPILVSKVAALPFVREVQATPDGLSLILADADLDAPALVTALVASGAQIRRLEEETHTLEEAYLEILGTNGSTG